MPGGAIMQLVSFGAQDSHLISDPEITFFNGSYQRHTNFALEDVEQAFTGEANFGKKVTCALTRTGDLVSGLTLQLTVPALDRSWFTVAGADLSDQGASDTALGLTAAVNTDSTTIRPSYVQSLGHAVIQDVSIDIGGQTIDKQYGLWMEILSEHHLSESKFEEFGRMVGRYPTLSQAATAATSEQTYYVPLQFWFCRNPGLALPLASIQFHEVRVAIQFRPMDQCVIMTDGEKYAEAVALPLIVPSAKSNISFTYCQLFGEYVFLDKAEREMFVSKPQEYLIEQVQFNGEETVNLNTGNPTVRHDLNFSHPVKEFTWVLQQQSVASPGTGDLLKNDWFNFGQNDLTVNQDSAMHGLQNDLIDNSLKSVQLQFNNYDRISPRPGNYFRTMQPYRHHTRIPKKSIYSYSLALKPEDHQPSGSINMSRIDTARLSYRLGSSMHSTLTPFGTGKTGTFHLFALNYNYLKVTNGMAGILYAS